MISKSLAILVAACAMTFALTACDTQKAPETVVEEKAEVVPVPAPGSDASAWKKYLAAVVMLNMEGVKSNRPYMYFVPAGDDGKAQLDRSNQLDNVKIAVSRGVLPGNMLAFGGPDSKTTADLIVDAFQDAQAGTFKDVLVLFVGAQADSDRVKDSLATVGATYRFAEMK
jgi:hypothetical protein